MIVCMPMQHCHHENAQNHVLMTAGIQSKAQQDGNSCHLYGTLDVFLQKSGKIKTKSATLFSAFKFVLLFVNVKETIGAGVIFLIFLRKSK